MNMKEIQIEFERGGKFFATLLRDKAPKTCELIWKELPFEGLGRHSTHSGPEIYFAINLPKTKKPRENFTSMLNLGDVGYWSEEFFWREETTPSGVGATDCFCIYYGISLPRDIRGREVISVFAKITEDLDNLAEIGERLHMKGAEKIFIKKTV